MNKREFNEYLKTEVYRGIYSPEVPLYKKIIMQFSTRHFNPSRRAVYLLRKMQYYRSKRSIGWWYAVYIERKIQREFGCYISSTAIIGKGFRLPHPVGIIIGAHVIIEENVTVYQDVTIGSARTGDSKKAKQPHVGEGSTIFAGAKVLGSINIAPNTIVAANAVLLHDTDDNGVYGGVPAKKINKSK